MLRRPTELLRPVQRVRTERRATSAEHLVVVADVAVAVEAAIVALVVL